MSTSTTLPFPHDPAAPVSATAPLSVGASVAHLVIERVLHEGPHTIVYAARDSSGAGQTIALMEYFPRALALRQPDGSVRARQAGDAIALSVGREAFVLDANTLESIDHPGVVHVLGSLQAHRTVYRGMTLIDAPTLQRQVLGRTASMPVADVVKFLDRLLDALEALHRKGVVHGCVRPDQILMMSPTLPVLLGMGSAGSEIAGHEPGPWSAPEQAATSRHDRIDSATDLYMAAATAWFAATGEVPPTLRERLAHPEQWEPAAAIFDLPEDKSEAPEARHNLALALSAALSLHPAERPQRVPDMRRLLHPPASGATFEPSGSTPLWMGVVPDRESQWDEMEQQDAAARGVPVPPPSAPAVVPLRSTIRSTPTSPVPLFADSAAPQLPPAPAPVLETQPAISGAEPVLHDAVTMRAERDEDDAAVPARQRVGLRWWWAAPALVALAALGWWWGQQARAPVPGVDVPIAGSVSSPAEVPPAALPATPPRATTNPTLVPAPSVTAAPANVAPVVAAPAAVAPTPVATAEPASAPAAAVPPSAAPTAAAVAATAAATAAAPAAAAAVRAPARAAAKPAKTAASSKNGKAAKNGNGSKSSKTPQRTAAAAQVPPALACGNRTQFSLLYCMQEQCAKPAYRYHAQCINLRRQGDIR